MAFTNDADHDHDSDRHPADGPHPPGQPLQAARAANEPEGIVTPSGLVPKPGPPPPGTVPQPEVPSVHTATTPIDKIPPGVGSAAYPPGVMPPPGVPTPAGGVTGGAVPNPGTPIVPAKDPVVPPHAPDSEIDRREIDRR